MEVLSMVEVVVVGIADGEVIGFFFLPHFVTVAQVSPKGLPARVGKSIGSGTGRSDKGQRVGPVVGVLRVTMGGSEKWTVGVGLDREAWLGCELERSGQVRNSLIKTKSECCRGWDFL
jgi:hypothetical protein